jgi:hypothetical protein
VRRVCDGAVNSRVSTGWRVTNNSLSGHLRSIEAPGAQAQIERVPLVLAVALVTIRVYNYAAVSPAELAAARAAADQIFQDTGISLQWVSCRVPNSPEGDTCTESLRTTGEFILRLQSSAPTGSQRHVALGSSVIDRSAGGGVLITIDPAQVHNVAWQSGTAPCTLLGRAIAHELGHMLIGTNEHADHGLMRALWSQAELRQDHDTDWHFSADEVEVMRKGVTTRQLGN